MNTKKLSVLVLFLVGILAMASFASATVTIDAVKVNGDDLDDLGITILDLERGEDFDVKVITSSDSDLSNVQIEARLRGYDHDDRVEDITDVFDMTVNVSYAKKLVLTLPDRMEKDEYNLIVTIDSREGQENETEYTFKISAPRHNLDIRDIVLSPESSVVAGRALLASVRVKNIGDKDEEGIKVRVSVPSLGISATDYIDEIEKEDSEQSEELYLRIPEDAESGSYKVVAEVEFDDGDETISEDTMIMVIAEEAVPATSVTTTTPTTTQTVITVGSQAQDVSAGKGGVIYPLTISNPGKTAKTATITVDAVEEWATVSITPSNVVVVGAGETKAVYVYVAAKSGASAGDHMFSVTVSGLSETPQQIPFTAKVVSAATGNLKRGLEIGLFVLVIIIVIIGLVIGFSRLKGSEEKEERESETYY